MLATSTRVALVVCSLLAIAPFGSGCHVGSADEAPPGGGTPDAAGGGGDGDDDAGGDGAGADASPPAPTVCQDRVQNVMDTGHHPIGYDFDQGEQGCITAGCHDGGTATAPQFSVGGSLWDTLNDVGNPISGAHVYVTDSAGKVVHMVTAMNGFFYSTEPLTPPLSTHASLCPDFRPMVSPPQNGNCNSAGCHVSNYKVYLNF